MPVARRNADLGGARRSTQDPLGALVLIPNIGIEASRIASVRELFSTDKNGIPLVRNHLEAVATELGRLASIDSDSTAKQRALARVVGYTTFRFNEFLGRRSFVEWLRLTLAEPGRDPTGLWNYYATLALKDFHVDVGSLMDSVAAVVISIDGELPDKELEKPPGFADIQRTTNRTYRKELAADVCETVDATDAWWLFVKLVRDLVAHRRHSRLVFGGAEDGFRFQVFVPNDIPLVTHPAFRAETGTGIADFSLYSSWVLIEVIYFFDSLGKLIKARHGMADEVLQASGRAGGLRPLIQDSEMLLRRLSDAYEGRA